jgi:DNA-binding PadR family transcriptional regulator
MPDARLLALVARCPEPAALARRGAGPLFPALRCLEDAGLVVRACGTYRLTRSGRSELELQRALARIIARAYGA